MPTITGLSVPTLPDALRGGAWDRLRDLEAERQGMLGLARAAAHDAATMPSTLQAAKKADQNAAGIAARAGQPDPGPVHLRAAEAMANDLQRRRLSTRQGIAQIEREMVDLIETSLPELRDATTDRLTAAQVALGDIAESAEVAAGDFAQLQAVAAWLDAPREKLRAGRTASLLAELGRVVAEIQRLAPPSVRVPVTDRGGLVMIRQAGIGAASGARRRRASVGS